MKIETVNSLFSTLEAAKRETSPMGALNILLDTLDKPCVCICIMCKSRIKTRKEVEIFTRCYQHDNVSGFDEEEDKL